MLLRHQAATETIPVIIIETDIANLHHQDYTWLKTPVFSAISLRRHCLSDRLVYDYSCDAKHIVGDLFTKATFPAPLQILVSWLKVSKAHCSLRSRFRSLHFLTKSCETVIITKTSPTHRRWQSPFHPNSVIRNRQHHAKVEHQLTFNLCMRSVLNLSQRL